MNINAKCFRKNMIDCQIINCNLYHEDCFFKTILVKKPDPKNGCSYFRKLKKEKAIIYDENGNKKRKIRSDKNQPRNKKRKSKSELNSLRDLL